MLYCRRAFGVLLDAGFSPVRVGLAEKRQQKNPQVREKKIAIGIDLNSEKRNWIIVFPAELVSLIPFLASFHE